MRLKGLLLSAHARLAPRFIFHADGERKIAQEGKRRGKEERKRERERERVTPESGGAAWRSGG